MSGVVIKLNEDEEDDEEEADVAGLLSRHRRQVRRKMSALDPIFSKI